ncbi:MAG TPA: DegT/DnrJ/EryC1/StrS family aminotransferase [bacterium]|nr:DegT/DnrJ/EryC1/StrS family aminotransferase [bacterium]HQL63065.1 DegT/DnrJ/EryC1/StrS family aminotransferase [bacterium]
MNEMRELSEKRSRRTFLKSSGVAAAGLALGGYTGKAIAQSANETLALNGGPKAVTFPSDRLSAATKWPRFGDVEKQAVWEIMDRSVGDVYNDLPVLEKEWCEYNKVPFAKAHCNGSSTLTSMFFALDLPPGSEIMVPSYTFFATILPMRFFQYVPIFIDLNPRTACFDLEYAAKHLTKNTKAMVPMHSWGLPCDMDEICKFADEKGLIVCEDAAHAHGASLKGKKMGAWGQIAIFSFQASKPLPAIEGGMGCYQTREYYERAAAFGHYEDPPKFPEDSPNRKYDGTGYGQKYRIHPIAAALARTQLAVLDERNAGVRKRIRELNDRITQLPGLSEPFCRKDVERVYYANNMILLDEAKAGITRETLLKALKAEGVWAGSGAYPEQHKYKIYSEEKWWHHKPVIPETLPGTEQVNRSCIYLPILYEDLPEVNEQYAKAFEKVWANRDKLS